MSSVHGPMTPIRKARIWELWRQGYPMSFIADDIAKPPATVYSYLLYHGGMEPRSRVRRSTSLTIEERETISRGLANHQSLRSIALELGRRAHPLFHARWPVMVVLIGTELVLRTKQPSREVARRI